MISLINIQAIWLNFLFNLFKVKTYIPRYYFVTTPTQPQLNSKVGCDTKMTLFHHHHHHRPPPTHRKLTVIDISAVPDPISTKL